MPGSLFMENVGLRRTCLTVFPPNCYCVTEVTGVRWMGEGGGMADEEEMDLNLHGVPRELVRRAKARAAMRGETLKEWVMGLMEGALGGGDEKSED